MLENIPHLSLKYPDRARRFITLVDELYEANCCLVCSAVDVPDRLFVGFGDEDEKHTIGSGSSSSSSSSSKVEVGGDGSEQNSASGNMLAVDAAQSHGIALGQLASVRELSFAFRRAASRLLEMCSESWWEEKGALASVRDASSSTNVG